MIKEHLNPMTSWFFFQDETTWNDLDNLFETEVEENEKEERKVKFIWYAST